MKKQKKSKSWKAALKAPKWPKALKAHYMSIPTLALVITFAVACGRMDSSSVSSPVQASAPAAASTEKAAAAEDAVPFSAWCEKAGGMLDEKSGLCELQLKRMYGHNYNVLWEQWWDTGLQVDVNDTVIVDVVGGPKMKIGTDILDKAHSGSFVARTAGHVEFTSRNMTAGFGVRQVTVKRCYAATGGTPRCH